MEVLSLVAQNILHTRTQKIGKSFWTMKLKTNMGVDVGVSSLSLGDFE